MQSAVCAIILIRRILLVHSSLQMLSECGIEFLLSSSTLMNIQMERYSLNKKSAIIHAAPAFRNDCKKCSRRISSMKRLEEQKTAQLFPPSAIKYKLIDRIFWVVARRNKNFFHFQVGCKSFQASSWASARVALQFSHNFFSAKSFISVWDDTSFI